MDSRDFSVQQTLRQPASVQARRSCAGPVLAAVAAVDGAYTFRSCLRTVSKSQQDPPPIFSQPSDTSGDLSTIAMG